MKLVLLPGMDGTGILFEAVHLKLQEMNTVVLPLPENGPQDYLTLATYVAKNLPDEDFILVAESFSGGIAAVLSCQNIPNLKGIIFVASFLSSPKRLLSRVVSYLPVSTMAQLTVANVLHRLLCLGWNASSQELGEFKRAINAVPSHVLKSRLKVIANTKYNGFKSPIPAVYIAALHDRLVPSKKIEEFKEAYPSIVVTELKGPHFLLQTQPKASSAAITKAVHLLTNKSNAVSLL